MTVPLARRPNTKRAIVAAVRDTNPRAGIYTLWLEYNAAHKERPIGWQYWMQVCREVDRAREARAPDEEKDNA